MKNTLFVVLLLVATQAHAADTSQARIAFGAVEQYVDAYKKQPLCEGAVSASCVDTPTVLKIQSLEVVANDAVNAAAISGNVNAALVAVGQLWAAIPKAGK